MFNIISATGGGWVGGVQFPGKKTLRNTWMAPMSEVKYHLLLLDRMEGTYKL